MNKTIYKLPVPSTALWKSPEFQKRLGRECALVCNYEEEENETDVKLTLIFEGVEAFKATYYKACSLVLVQNAYSKVVDFGETTWLKEIKSNLIENEVEETDLFHLAIYFDDGPAYEFICKKFRVEEIKSD